MQPQLLGHHYAQTLALFSFMAVRQTANNTDLHKHKESAYCHD